MLFAVTYRERVWALVCAGAFANRLWTSETPWNPTEAEYDREVVDGERRWGDHAFVAMDAYLTEMEDFLCESWEAAAATPVGRTACLPPFSSRTSSTRP